MRKLIMALAVLSLVVVGLMGTGLVALAAQPQDVPGYGNDFVCPVITSTAVGEHNPVASPLGESGAYTVVRSAIDPHHLNVPDQATNGGGMGSPGDTTGDNAQAQPGDRDYTAIWNGDAPKDP